MNSVDFNQLEAELIGLFKLTYRKIWLYYSNTTIQLIVFPIDVNQVYSIVTLTPKATTQTTILNEIVAKLRS